MGNSPLLPDPPAIIRQAPMSVVRPATSEQAMDMLRLMMAEMTAIIRCNNHKSARAPEQAGMKLLAVPYTPNQYEFLYLTGRHIMADQMAFLRAGFNRLQA